jgi:hypothetical protein
VLHGGFDVTHHDSDLAQLAEQTAHPDILPWSSLKTL